MQNDRDSGVNTEFCLNATVYSINKNHVGVWVLGVSGLITGIKAVRFIEEEDDLTEYLIKAKGIASEMLFDEKDLSSHRQGAIDKCKRRNTRSSLEAF